MEELEEILKQFAENMTTTDCTFINRSYTIDNEKSFQIKVIVLDTPKDKIKVSYKQGALTIVVEETDTLPEFLWEGFIDFDVTKESIKVYVENGLLTVEVLKPEIIEFDVQVQ